MVYLIYDKATGAVEEIQSSIPIELRDGLSFIATDSFSVLDIENYDIVITNDKFISSSLKPLWERKVIQIDKKMRDLFLESATDKARIKELEMQQGDLLLEIASLKAGGVV